MFTCAEFTVEVTAACACLGVLFTEHCFVDCLFTCVCLFVCVCVCVVQVAQVTKCRYTRYSVDGTGWAGSWFKIPSGVRDSSSF